jgi:prepilin-type N-terminal cleavage/methylation domain-containing protein
MKRRGAGFTLIEVLVCLGMLAIIFSIIGMTFAEIVRLRGTQERYAHRRDAALHLLRQVAKEVRESSGFLDAADGASSDEHTLIFRHEGETLVYRSEPGRVTLARIGESGRDEETALEAAGVDIRFAVEGGPAETARSAVITAEWKEPPRLGVSHPVLSLRAARRARP